jgi:protein-S-isoprenylcysteine O-methyltransferase Ste14
MENRQEQEKQDIREAKILNIRIVARFIFGLLFFGGAFFGTAGTFNWPEAWIYLFIQYSLSIYIVLWLKKNNPALLKDRMTYMKKTSKGWDKAITIASFPFMIALLVIPGFDAVRYQWSYVSTPVKVVSFLIIFASFLVFFRVMKENPFLSRVIEVQKERDHKVITTGPYRIIRHPMNAGVIPLFFCIPLALGSLYAIVPAIFFLIIIVIRTHLEDKTLHKELEGYAEYAQKTKYKLVPGIW